MASEKRPVKVREPIPHLKALDSWRGLGCVLVALSHFPGGGYLAENAFVYNAQPLVDYFFTLSGFVIAANYLDRINDKAGFGAFMWLRVARIYPLHLFTFGVLFVFELAKAAMLLLSTGSTGDAFTGDRTMFHALTNLFAVHSLGIHDTVSWNRPAWSISCEMFAYLVFAVLTFVGGRRWRFPLYFSAAALSMLILALYSNEYFLPTATYGAFRCIAGFMSGVFSFWVWDSVRSYTFWKRIPDFVWTIMEFGSCTLLYIFLSNVGIAPGSFASPFIFFWFVFLFSFQRGFMSKMMQWDKTVYLGAISYSIYMVHQFIFERILNVAKVLENLLGIPLTRMGEEGYTLLGTSPLMADFIFVFAIILVIITSHFTYVWVEEYFRKKAKSALKNRKARQKAREESTLVAPVAKVLPENQPAEQKS